VRPGSAGEAVLGVVVAEPPVEEVARMKKRRRRARLFAEEPEEPLRDAGARGREMQIGDEERRVHARTRVTHDLARS